MPSSSSKVTRFLFILLSAMALAAIINNFYIFFYQKNYKFIVEALCDSKEQSCFIRHCGEDAECPPNGLEQYRQFSLNASDFKKCSDDSCLNECTSGVIKCIEISCDESAGDSCLHSTLVE